MGHMAPSWANNECSKGTASPESNWAPNDAIYTMMEMSRDEVLYKMKPKPNI